MRLFLSLKIYTKPCETSKEIEQVGTISANSDSIVGQLIAQAMEKVGKEGVITADNTPIAMVIPTNEELVIAQDTARLAG